jgi:PEP-CTERM motif
MRTALLSTVMTLALLAPAAATLQIAFSNGAANFFCADQTACDLDGAAKNLLLLNTVVGDIKITGTFAASTTSPNDLSISNLTITNLSTSKKETLDMAVGDTGFSAPTSFIRSSASLTFTNDNGGSGTLGFWADKADTQPAVNSTDLPGVLLFSTAETVTTSPDSFSGTKDTPFSASLPFSMAEGAVLTLNPGASITGFNESMASGIPEPKTWMMALVGFGLLGAIGWRRAKTARYAI